MLRAGRRPSGPGSRSLLSRQTALGRDRCPFLILLEGLEHEIADLVLGRRIQNRAKERIAAPFAVHAVLAGGERDVPATVASAPFPDGKANQLQPFERAFREM